MRLSLVSIFSLLFITFNTNAGEYSVYPKIYFMSAQTWVEANKTCIDSENLYHKEKDSVVLEYCDDHGNNCTYKEKPLVQPISAQTSRCAKLEKDECVKWETYTINQGPVVKVKVFPSKNDAENDRNQKRTTPYNIESCENI